MRETSERTELWRCRMLYLLDRAECKVENVIVLLWLNLLAVTENSIVPLCLSFTRNPYNIIHDYHFISFDLKSF